jgi:N,N'-diacetyllegionaminate synthase
MSGKKYNKKNFIAEIASSHNGSKKNLQKLVEDLINSNIGAIKLQIFNYQHLVHKSYKYYDVLKRIALPKKFIEKIIHLILKAKKDVVLEPFDNESLKFCKKFGNKISIKISSSDNTNKQLIKESLTVFKKVFISINGMDLKKIKKVLGKNITHKRLILTYGFQSFPTKIQDLRLNFIKILQKAGYRICYADHTSANSLVDNILTIKKAIDNGSEFIEKHVTLDRNKGYPDSDSSLEIKEFINLINFFNKEIPNKNLISKNEKKYSKNMTRYAVINKKINKNQIFKSEDVSFLRLGKKGITKDQIKKFKNKKYNNNFKDNEILKKEFFFKK